MYDAYSSGTLTYDDWTTQIEKLYLQRGVATKDKVAKTLSNYTLKPYAKDIIKYLQDKDYQVAIITGGFIITAEHLANVLNVSHYVANTRLRANI